MTEFDTKTGSFASQVADGLSQPAECAISQHDSSSKASLPTRYRLPDTRHSLTHKFRINSHEGYIIVGLFEDGRPGEVFLKMSKQGSTLNGLLNTVGILTSMCLQYGVPVEGLARKFEYMRFEPSGWTPNPDLKEVTSIVDYIFRWLGQTFPARYRAEKTANLDPSPDSVT